MEVPKSPHNILVISPIPSSKSSHVSVISLSLSYCGEIQEVQKRSSSPALFPLSLPLTPKALN